MAGVAARFPGSRLGTDVMRFSVALPAENFATSGFLNRVAISPDGTHIACNALLANQRGMERGGTGRLGVLIRSLRELEWKRSVTRRLSAARSSRQTDGGLVLLRQPKANACVSSRSPAARPQH